MQRAIDEIRALSSQVTLLPRTHGSGLFTRGQTQALSICTLGALGDVQILDGLGIEESGTLDPAVTGVLPICIGQATKVAEYMSDYAKAYEAEVTLGIATTTEDQTGEMIEQVDIDQLLTNEQIDATLKTFQGEITQIPPMYSAVKVNGRRLYDYARKNEVVERPKRLVNIYEIIRLDDVQLDQEAKVMSSSCDDYGTR